MPTTPGPGGRVTRNCERSRAETHRGEASDAAHRNSYTDNFGAVSQHTAERSTVLKIYTYPSRIYKILNVLEPFSYASYLVFVCESNALFEYDSRPITP